MAKFHTALKDLVQDADVLMTDAVDTQAFPHHVLQGPDEAIDRSFVTPHPNPSRTLGDRTGKASNFQGQLWYPFINEKEYKLAKWFIEAEVPKTRINEFFNTGCGPSDAAATGHFASAHGLWQKIAEMDCSGSDALEFTKKDVDFGVSGAPVGQLLSRDPIKVLRYLLRQPAYAPHLVWDSHKVFDSENQRCYSEMHTGDYWWNEQVWKMN